MPVIRSRVEYRYDIFIGEKLAVFVGSFDAWPGKLQCLILIRLVDIADSDEFSHLREAVEGLHDAPPATSGTYDSKLYAVIGAEYAGVRACRDGSEPDSTSVPDKPPAVDLVRHSCVLLN